MPIMSSPAPGTTQHVAKSRFQLRPIVVGLFVVLAVWLFLPALTSGHVEAFSARLQTMAMLDLHGQFARDDLAYPLNLEYFYMTRGGTMHALEWMMMLTHTTGEMNFRILIWVSYLVFAASSIRFVRRWSPEPVWAAIVVLVVTPGLIEISFFFSDNLPSAAMVALALAIVAKRSPYWRWIVSGAALGCGVLLRTDAILAIPLLLLLALAVDDMKWQRLVMSWAATLGGIASVLVTFAKLTTVTLWNSLQIAKLHTAIHRGWGDSLPFHRSVVLFFGPTVILLLLGISYLYRSRSWQWKLAMICGPALFYLGALIKTIELRDYLLLGAPFVLLHGAVGLRRLLHLLEIGTPLQRRAAWAAVAVFVFSLICPPMLVMQDGPRVFLGRIYSPPMWRRWQSSTREAIQQVKSVAASVAPGERIVILSSLFQSDRYLHLALLEDGFAILPLREQSGCGGVETFQKNDRTIFHIRTENPYYLLSRPPLSLPNEYVRAYQIHSGIGCLVAEYYDRAMMLTWGRMLQGYMQDTPEFLRHTGGPLEIPFPQYGTPHIGKYKYLQVQRLVPLSREDVEDLDARAEATMKGFEADNNGGWRPPRNDKEFREQGRPLIWQTVPR